MYQETAKQLKHERDLLGEALGKILIAADVVREDANLTGPMLLCIAEDYTDHLNQAKGG